MSTPKTFEAHGHTWTAHTPGDPMPCDKFNEVCVITRDEVNSDKFGAIDQIQLAEDWRWEKISECELCEIIGWRSANEQPRSASAWRPIAEAPKDDTTVDIWSKSNGRLTNYFRSEHENGDWFYDPVEDGVTTVRDATHFMPLPEPPTE